MSGFAAWELWFYPQGGAPELPPAGPDAWQPQDRLPELDAEWPGYLYLPCPSPADDVSLRLGGWGTPAPWLPLQADELSIQPQGWVPEVPSIPFDWRSASNLPLDAEVLPIQPQGWVPEVPSIPFDWRLGSNLPVGLFGEPHLQLISALNYGQPSLSVPGVDAWFSRIVDPIEVPSLLEYLFGDRGEQREAALPDPLLDWLAQVALPATEEDPLSYLHKAGETRIPIQPVAEMASWGQPVVNPIYGYPFLQLISATPTSQAPIPNITFPGWHVSANQPAAEESYDWGLYAPAGQTIRSLGVVFRDWYGPINLPDLEIQDPRYLYSVSDLPRIDYEAIVAGNSAGWNRQVFGPPHYDEGPTLGTELYLFSAIQQQIQQTYCYGIGDIVYYTTGALLVVPGIISALGAGSISDVHAFEASGGVPHAAVPFHSKAGLVAGTWSPAFQPGDTLKTLWVKKERCT